MSSTLISDRFDLPKQIVRPLAEGEQIPFYSTAELLLGVSHLQRTLADSPLARMKAGAIKAARKRSEKVRAMLDRVRPEIKERLAAGDKNREIAERLNLTRNQLMRILQTDTELREASAKRPRHMPIDAARKQADSNRRFALSESAIRKTAADRGVYNAAREHGFGDATLKRLLGASNAKN